MTLWSLMHSELSFLQSERKWSNFILLHVTVNLPAPAIEDNVFTYGIVVLFMKTNVDVEVWDNNMWFLISILFIIVYFHTDIMLVLLLEL